MSEEEILVASRQLFAKYGYDYVSVRQIASEANVNIGSISYYFHNKIGILQRIVEDFYKGLKAAVDPVLDEPVVNKTDAIRNLTHSALKFMLSNYDSTRIVMREITLEERFDEVVKANNVAVNNRFIAFFENMKLPHPRQAAIKFTAFIRFPFSSVNIVELYYPQSFQNHLDDYVEIVLSAFHSELSA